MVAAAAIAAAAVSAGAGLYGSSQSSGAAKSAARSQEQAARDAMDTQWRMFQQARDDQAPYRGAGYGALTQLGILSDQPLTYPAFDVGPYAFDAGPYAFGATPYAFKPPTAADLPNDPGYQFRVQEGQKALERSGSARGLTLSGGQLKSLQRFGQDLGSQEYGAAYGRALGQNQLAYERALGQNQLAYNRAYGTNQDRYSRARDAYTLGYNTLTGLRGANFNELASLAGLGQTSVQQLGQLGSQTGGRLADLQTGIGNAQAAGAIGQANALNQGLGSVSPAGNNFANYQLLSSLMKQPPSSIYGGNYGGLSQGYNQRTIPYDYGF